jgi:Flp pilus assembly protein TadD
MERVIMWCSLLCLLVGCAVVHPPQSSRPQSSLALQGQQLFEQQRYNEALPVYRELISQAPANADAHYTLGIVYERLGQDKAAVDSYREAIRLKPDYVDAHIGLAVAYARTGQDELAIAAYREIIRLRPNDAGAYYNTGVAFGKIGQDAQAIAAYREAVRLKPDYAEAYYGLGLAHERMGQDEPAIASYREVIRLRPNDAEAHNSLALAYERIRQDAQAIAAYREVIRLRPNDAETYANLGVVYERMGQHDQAAAAYRELVRLKPTEATASYNLAVAYSRAGQHAQAIAAYREAIRLKPENAEAYSGLAATYQAKGEQQEALSALEKYRSLKPGEGLEQVVLIPGVIERRGPGGKPVAPTPQLQAEPTPPPQGKSLPESQPEQMPQLHAESVARPPVESTPEPRVERTPEPRAESMPPSPSASPPRSPAESTPPPVAERTPTPPKPPVPQPAQRRTALVIGNAGYRSAPLRNPVNDAAAMAASLQQLGFAVTELRDVNHQRMEEAVAQFHRQLRGGGVGLFYFSGHGAQANGQNYLIPVDTQMETEADIKYHGIQADWVVESMKDADNELNIVILDACRDNPFIRSSRSAQQGLAPMQSATGVLIAYATAPGAKAEDGSDRNGTYTKYLLHFMQVPDLGVEQVFKQVREAVARDTKMKQIPWVSTSILGDFYFIEAAQEAPRSSREGLITAK